MFQIETLYHEYKLDVYRYLMSLTHHPTLSEDLMSETFLRALKGIASFRGEADVRTWLFSIARRTWYEHLRKQKKEVSLDELTNIYLSESLETHVFHQTLAERVMVLLEEVDERAKAIVLQRINGYSYYEIATVHGISEGSARIIDFRTKKRVKEQLQKEGYDHE
ncbi:MAG: RNA polymerase sigma factor [Bacilli bacterium]